MIEIETFHHVGLVVTDLNAAKAFYGQLHLVVHPPALALRGTTEIDSRDGHLALRVADFQATRAHLKLHGVPVLESRINLRPWAQIYITDPHGNVFELNAERPATSRRSPASIAVV